MDFPIIKTDIANSKRIAIILAAGKGKRMGDPGRNKVCYPIAGIPVINRIIETYKHCGFQDIIVVVGYRYEDVISVVNERFSDINFIYQEQPLGTGNAVKCACRYLESVGFNGDIFISAGDKLVDGNLLVEMRETFESGDYDLLFATGTSSGGEFGRVIRDDTGRIVSIVEAKDIELLKKQGREDILDLVEKSDETNQSLYFIKAPLLYSALKEIKSNNAQQEEYITDIVNILSKAGAKIDTFLVTDKDKILSFNTPQELLEIEMYFQRIKLKELNGNLRNPANYKMVSEWIEIFTRKDRNLLKLLADIYRDDTSIIDKKINMYLKVLDEFRKRFGPDRYVSIIRSPGRLNIMGRHIDHRGGAVNIIAIDKEIIMVAEPRKDDIINLYNIQEDKFPPREFSISKEMSKLDWSSWLNAINSDGLKEELNKNSGDWANYVKASALKIQERFRDIKILGMNAVVLGDIPIGSGLSSSSSMVVASAEAITLVNQLNISPEEFVKLCGEGEWYVGTRGGSGDHAAIKFGMKGNISQIKFFEFEFAGSAPLPKGYSIVFCYSQEQAKKAENAKNVFNQKVACYELGTMILRKVFPELSSKMRYLRDITPENLGIPEYEIYQILKSLPERISREEVRQFFGNSGKDTLDRIFSTHSAPFEGYPIRGVCLFGISECARSKACLDLLSREDTETLGELMNISHNGDRVTGINEYGERVLHINDVSINYLNKLIEGNKRLNDKKFSIAYQSGDYGCSTYKIDMLVDLANSVPGVLGAQVAGAGLGGCVMVLCRSNVIDLLKDKLTKSYYEPFSLDPLVEEAIPVKGSGFIELS
ncbi:MAG TPA: NTP transferase domain-containing protein [bacterium]|nr:NTP transferase domain-containing protein [bacterium]